MRWRAASRSRARWCSGCATTLGLIAKSAEIETLARTVEDNGGVYFVPAFSGLYAPYWKHNARGVIAGLTRYANKGHIARAVLEASGVPDARSGGGDGEGFGRPARACCARMAAWSRMSC